MPLANKIEDARSETLPDSFLELQKRLFMLRPIHTKSDYRKAVRIAGILASREDLTKNQSDYLETLSNNIHEYEAGVFQTDMADPIEILKFLLEDNGMNASDLGNILNNRALGSKILRGERNLSKNHILKLAEYFSVNPGLFLKVS